MIICCGDVHGKVSEYKKILDKYPNDYHVQLGDFSFDYSILNDYDTRKVKLILGNHDNYDKIPPHSLGDFGEVKLDNMEFFFVRGADSIDKQYRIEGVSWWRNEELTYEQLDECITLYERVKPYVVLSHTCPKFLISYLGGQPQWGNKTENAMNQMWSIHQPYLWVHGHYHQSKVTQIENTKFVCLDELETMEI
jgi:predicted phosphodiesterase